MRKTVVVGAKCSPEVVFGVPTLKRMSSYSPHSLQFVLRQQPDRSKQPISARCAQDASTRRGEATFCLSSQKDKQPNTPETCEIIKKYCQFPDGPSLFISTKTHSRKLAIDFSIHPANGISGLMGIQQKECLVLVQMKLFILSA